MAIVFFIASLICLVSGDYEASDIIDIIVLIFSSLGFFVIVYVYYYTSPRWIVINDSDKTLTVSSDRKHPIDIIKIDQIDLHLDMEGRAYRLTTYNAGVQLVEFSIRHSREHAIMENFMKINPKIKIVPVYPKSRGD